MIPATACALLVIDAQNAFCHPQGTLGISGVDTGPMQTAIPRIRAVVEWARGQGIPDIWTVQEHFLEDHAREGRLVAPHTSRRQRVACLPGSWDAQVVEDLGPSLAGARYVIRKHRFSAFHGTALDVILRAWGRRAVILTGFTTNACVETTAREAYMRDLDVLLVADAMAGVKPQWHRLALEVLGSYVGRVIDSAELFTVVGGD